MTIKRKRNNNDEGSSATASISASAPPVSHRTERSENTPSYAPDSPVFSTVSRSTALSDVTTNSAVTDKDIHPCEGRNEYQLDC